MATVTLLLSLSASLCALVALTLGLQGQPRPVSVPARGLRGRK